MLPEISSFVETLFTPVTAKVVAFCISKILVILISKAQKSPSVTATEHLEKTCSVININTKHKLFPNQGKLKGRASYLKIWNTI